MRALAARGMRLAAPRSASALPRPGRSGTGATPADGSRHDWDRPPKPFQTIGLRERARPLVSRPTAALRGRCRGAPRVHAELALAHGVRVGRKRVEWLMRAAGLSGLVPRRRGRTTVRVPGVRVADDLVGRQFRPAAPNVLWLADITYLRTWEGWLYLAAVQDAFSRRIVGWSMADHMRSELVIDALNMAVARRRPDVGLIHHSDQGSQFVSLPLARPRRKAGIARSMGSTRRLLGQRRRRNVLRDAQERARSTAAPGPTAKRSDARSSTTSRSSITRPAGTPPSGCSPRSATRMRASRSNNNN